MPYTPPGADTSTLAPIASPTFTGVATAPSFAASGKTGATATPLTLAGGTASGAPTTGAHVKGELVADDTGALWYCTVAGTPGTWKLAGSPALLVNSLASDTAIVANTFLDMCSLSLAAGTWRLVATASLSPSGGGAYFTAKLWDGTTVSRSCNAYMPQDGGAVQVTTAPVDVVLASTTTLKWSATCNQFAGVARTVAQTNATGTTGTLTVLTAQRVA